MMASKVLLVRTAAIRILRSAPIRGLLPRIELSPIRFVASQPTSFGHALGSRIGQKEGEGCYPSALLT